MSDFQPTITRIANKVKQLLKQQDQLGRENDRLKANLLATEKQRDELTEKVADLEQKLSILQAAAGKMDDKSKIAFEKKINQYIRDIDKVIVHLDA